MRDSRRKVVGLIRVSTKEQADDDRAGIARQRQVIERTIQSRGLECERVVELNDVSGTNVRNCPEVQAILHRVQSGAIQGVVVADLDRLLRPERFEDFALLQVFQDSGALLFCSDQEIDLASDTGYLMAGFQALLAGNELRTIKRRMLGAKEEKRRQGKCPSPSITLPLGVRYDRGAEAYSYDDQISRVQEAFKLLDSGECHSVAAVARRIGLTPRGMAHVLRNPIYIGIRHYTHKRGPEKYVRVGGRQGDRKKIARSPGETISVRVIDTPAVAEDRFRRVQKLLDSHCSAWHVGRSAQTVHLGSSVLKCGHCGASMNCKSGTSGKRRKRGYYVCKHNDVYWRKKGKSCSQPNIAEDEVEALVTTFVAEKLADPRYLDAVVQHYVAMLRDTASEQAIAAQTTQERLQSLERRLGKMEELYYAGGYSSPQEYMAQKGKVDAEMRQIRSSLGTPECATPLKLEPTIRWIVKGALAFRRIQSRRDQRQVVLSLVAAITVKGSQIVGFTPTLPGVDADVGVKDTRTGTGSWPPPA